jgi:hypothetical protein
MDNSEALWSLLIEIRDLQSQIAKRQRTIAVMSGLVAFFGAVICAALICEVAVVVLFLMGYLGR